MSANNQCYLFKFCIREIINPVNFSWPHEQGVACFEVKTGHCSSNMDLSYKDSAHHLYMTEVEKMRALNTVSHSSNTKIT